MEVRHSAAFLEVVARSLQRRLVGHYARRILDLARRVAVGEVVVASLVAASSFEAAALAAASLIDANATVRVARAALKESAKVRATESREAVLFHSLLKDRREEAARGWGCGRRVGFEGRDRGRGGAARERVAAS